MRSIQITNTLIAGLLFLLGASSVAKAELTEPVPSHPENRIGVGIEEPPICPDGNWKSGGFGDRGDREADYYLRHCLLLDPKHVSGSGELKTEDFSVGARANSWKVWNKGAAEWVDFWNVNYHFAAEEITWRGIDAYKLCGCFRDHRRNGCFTPDTKIRMADGQDKQIKDIAAGEYILNPKTGDAVRIKQIIEGPEAIPLVVIKVNGKELKMSSQHPVLVYSDNTLSPAGMTQQTQDLDGGALVAAADLQVGSLVRLADGTIGAVEKLDRPVVEEGQYVVNLILESKDGSRDSHLLISEGVVTGDLVLQMRLARQRAQ